MKAMITRVRGEFRVGISMSLEEAACLMYLCGSIYGGWNLLRRTSSLVFFTLSKLGITYTTRENPINERMIFATHHNLYEDNDIDKELAKLVLNVHNNWHQLVVNKPITTDTPPGTRQTILIEDQP